MAPVSGTLETKYTGSKEHGFESHRHQQLFAFLNHCFEVFELVFFLCPAPFGVPFLLSPSANGRIRRRIQQDKTDDGRRRRWPQDQPRCVTSGTKPRGAAKATHINHADNFSPPLRPHLSLDIVIR